MSLIWRPDGSLNIATDPSALPESSQGSTIVSDALTRCKNLRLERKGLVQTRDGSSKISETQLAAAPSLIVEQAGNRYEFASTIIYQNESSIATGLTNAQWSAIKYNSFNDTTQNVFALNGTDRKRIEGTTVREWGIEAPTIAPTTAVGSLTGLTGTYNAKYTYLRKVGSVVVSESNPSPAGTARALTNQSLSVTWTASSDPQVTHVRIYRTLTSGLVYFEDQDIAIGTVTVDTNTADGSLGDSVETDHDRPPLGQFVSGPSYDGTSFIVKENLLYYSKPKQPEFWPSTFFIEVSIPQFPGKCPVVFHNGQPYFLTATEIYLIQGTGDGTFFPIPMKAKTGCQGVFCALSVYGKGIFHVSSDGIYLFSGDDKKITEETFDPIFRGETVNGLPGVSDITTSWLLYFKNKVYFGYTSTGNTYPSNILVFNLDTGRTAYYNYNDGTEIQIRTLIVDETNGRIVSGDSNGYIRKLEDTSIATDSGTAITYDLQSKDYLLQTRAHFPRWIKYDIDASDAVTCTGSIILDGTTVQSHTITENRDTRYRLIDTCNGKRAAMRVNGTGVVKVYMTEME